MGHFWEDGHDELYNVVKDIHEDTNLAKSQSKRAQEMSKTLLNWLKKNAAEYPKPNPGYDETKEQVAIQKNKEQVMKGQEE